MLASDLDQQKLNSDFKSERVSTKLPRNGLSIESYYAERVDWWMNYFTAVLSLLHQSKPSEYAFRLSILC